MRKVRQLVELLARVVGVAQAGQVDDAKRELDRLYSSQLGMPRRMVDRLTAATALATLGAEKARMLVLLLEAEVEIHRSSADESAAAVTSVRADELRTALGWPPSR